MKYLILTLFLGLSACGFNGTQELKTNDSKQVVEQLGESFAYVVVRLDFIQEIKDLCTDKHGPEETQLIAECTLENMSILSIDFNPIADVNETFCNRDLEGLTPEEIAEIERVCGVLNGI